MTKLRQDFPNSKKDKKHHYYGSYPDRRSVTRSQNRSKNTISPAHQARECAQNFGAVDPENQNAASEEEEQKCKRHQIGTKRCREGGGTGGRSSRERISRGRKTFMALGPSSAATRASDTTHVHFRLDIFVV
ncbi:hypothetical protein H6P81_001835 [Aristolochia fimbriata]|uniref:Uncharacterized protein n=1 Tax=Aristolochia fimbriata TaxID=158543 RepID=A0AAV7F838_ARIFI|nr:hypothetical protein H6P81_001835 [Aristolochia fimbriata]